jgi:hypothetical protein
LAVRTSLGQLLRPVQNTQRARRGPSRGHGERRQTLSRDIEAPRSSFRCVLSTREGRRGPGVSPIYVGAAFRFPPVGGPIRLETQARRAASSTAGYWRDQNELLPAIRRHPNCCIHLLQTTDL